MAVVAAIVVSAPESTPLLAPVSPVIAVISEFAPLAALVAA